MLLFLSENRIKPERAKEYCELKVKAILAYSGVRKGDQLETNIFIIGLKALSDSKCWILKLLVPF